ncbi:hypothetical protein AZ78_4136 [Lysobacter capsici AZ78]|uniref:Uncharacterized protein n=1 Tax=Lysobacter capsici AZ78 TaxID=1444315 RepID=A0A108UCF3_9GAMM|nr:hypothetical protein AZ78_4136 [Lysobacter capsici AZ78]
MSIAQHGRICSDDIPHIGEVPSGVDIAYFDRSAFAALDRDDLAGKRGQYEASVLTGTDMVERPSDYRIQTLGSDPLHA